jgi:hypothetical protein
MFFSFSSFSEGVLSTYVQPYPGNPPIFNRADK